MGQGGLGQGLRSLCIPPPPPHTQLEVPLRLEQRVRPHVNLRFDDFYDLIHHNFALIPTLASESYFDSENGDFGMGDR